MDFHYTDRIGGAEVQAWLLAKELARRGYKVVYLAQSLSGKAGVIEERDGVEIYWLEPVYHFHFARCRQYYQALKLITPNLLIQRTTSFFTGVIGHYAYKHKVPFVWMATDNWVPKRWFSLRREYRGLAKKSFLQKLRSPVFFGNALINDLARDYGMRYVTMSFTQNITQATNLRKNYGRSSLSMTSGHSVPDSDSRLSVQDKNGSILWVGNPGRNKRPELFVELAHHCKHCAFEFIMIGVCGSIDSTGLLQRPLPQNLRMLGRLPFEVTQQWFQKAKLVINTSLEEGFPNTFIQAWLYGTPVASLGVDPDGLVRRHRLGIVCETVDELAQAITRLLADPDAYSKMSHRVADFASQHYTIERVANRFLAVLKLPDRLPGDGEMAAMKLEANLP